MSQKNETLVLALSLLTTILFIAGGFWWFTKKSNLKINEIINPQPTGSSSSNQKPIQNISTQLQGKKFTDVQNVPRGLFNYGGSTSWAPIREKVDPVIQTERPEFRLRYVQPSNAAPDSATGIQSLIDGQLSFSQSSRPILDQELSRAQQRGFKLNQIPVAIDGLAIAVNPNLNIPGLTIDQLKSIYTGKINNWNQVGGPNLSIKPYSRRITDVDTLRSKETQIL
jgi:phosphate transport system substrate-binding protein